jgi:hypothetical protein
MGNLGYLDSAAPIQIVDENNERYMKLNTDGSVPTTDIIGVGGVNGQITFTNTPVEIKVGGSRYTSRRVVMFQALSAGTYWGFSASTSSTNGFPIATGQTVSLSIGDVAIYVVGSSVSSRTLAVIEAV